jgi:hypothetical protein
MSVPQGTQLFRIPGTITVTHYNVQRALVAGWESLSTPSFREAMIRAVSECARLRVKTWIADLTKNPGVPSQADLDWLKTGAKQPTADSGIRAVINVLGKSTLATMGANQWSKGAAAGGLVAQDAHTLEEALQLASDVAEGKLRAK